MKPFAIIILLAIAAWPSGAHAFWPRSHWQACAEAQTEAERVRLSCYIFAPAYYWPLDPYAVEVPLRPLPPRYRK